MAGEAIDAHWCDMTPRNYTPHMILDGRPGEVWGLRFAAMCWDTRLAFIVWCTLSELEGLSSRIAIIILDK